MARPPSQDTPFALITGGNRGIGFAIAKHLRAAGHAVGLVARDQDQLARAAGELGPDVRTLALDLCAPDAPARVLAAFAAQPIDVLVNNAGVAPSQRFETTLDAVLRQVLTLHVEVPFALIRGVLPGMKARGRGTIVQVASTAGLRGFPFTAAYAAAKHGLVGLTRALIAELREGEPRVFAVCPGFVDTELTRASAAAVAARGKQSADEALAKMGAMNVIGRLHQVDEIAAFVVELCARRPASGLFDLDREPPSRVD
jgi:NAD(P)-dependent dehydrogenase (short-subunit alcohol dehydrogenase family)